MSAITIDNDLVHYEVLGRGRPVILVHGWLSSWRYWIPTMQQLSMKYRTYALDLWGYGDSGKNPERFSLEAHVKLLDDFMEKMGIPKAALIGHSLGAAVVIRYALQRPERAARLMAISAPVFETAPGDGPAAAQEAPATPGADQPTPAPPIESAATPPTAPETDHTGNPSPAGGSGAPAEAAGQEATQPMEPATPPPPPFAAPTVPRRPPALDVGLGEQTPPPEIVIGPQDVPQAEANASPAKAANNPLRARLVGADARQLLERFLSREVPDFDKLGLEAAKTAPTALAASALSFDGVELAHDVRRLSNPTLLVHGEKDAFLPPPSRRLIDFLARDKGDFRCVIWPEINHFPMLDDPSAFHRLVMDFLEIADLDDLEFKERWVRKVR